MQIHPLMAVFGALAMSANAWPAGYIYDFVADTTGPAQGVGPPTINSSGNVVISVNLDLGGQDIYRGTSVPLDIIAQTGPAGGGQFVSFGNAPGMNSSGLVVFTATLPNGLQAIYTDNGGPSTLIIDSLGQFSGFGTPTINDAGQIAFTGTLDAPVGGGVYLMVPGISVTPIAQTSGPYSSFDGDAALSVDGHVLFRAVLDGGSVGIFLGSGGTAETIISSDDSDYAAFNSHAMSPAGVVAYAATHLDGSQGVYLIPEHSKPPELIAHSDGEFEEFLEVAVSDSLQVAFLAVANKGGQAGIYTGCNPETDAVVEVGDILNGHEIVGLLMGTRAVSDDGHVVFVAFYENGERGLYIAMPDPSAVDPPPPPPQGMAGDLDGDDDVDGVDLAILLGNWGKCLPQPKPLPCIPGPDACPGDLDDTGAINGFDLALLLAAWTGPGRG